jgi:cytochrome P450
MVITETLRLYPVVPGLGREAVSDCQIGGYPVPKGTSLFLSMWTVHRDQRFFDQPGEFIPDRWADGLAARLPPFAYFPFGGGPRRCIGASFGMMEAVLVLASVVQRFHLSVQPGQKIEPWVIPSLRPKFGLRMAIQAR